MHHSIVCLDCILRSKVWLMALVVLLLASTVMAQTTGKLAGKVTEQATGDGLPGVNVFVEGTNLGASTDLEGYYTIINVPPGTYTLVVSFIGYKKLHIENVGARVNYTTTVDAALEEEIVAGEAVTIIAERPLIEKDQTGSKDVVTSTEITALPVTNFDQVVELQAGIVGKNFRGGRETEVLYLVDGVQVLEPLSGQRSATVGIQAIENLEVISGTFNAEYGKAMSGIVNAVTKTGSEEYAGHLQYYTGNFFTSDDRFSRFNTVEPSGIVDFRGTLNGPVPLARNKLSFLISGGHQKNDGFLFGQRLFRPTDVSIPAFQGENAIFLGSGDGSDVPLNDSEETNFLGKLNYSMSGAVNLSYSLLYNKRDAHERWAYDDNNWDQWRWAPDGVRRQRNEAFNHIASFKHVLGNTAFYNIRLAYQDHSFADALFDDPLDAGYLPGDYRQGDLTGNHLFIGGTDLQDDRRDSKTITLKGDLTWQADRQHELKLGFEGIRYEVQEDKRTILFANEAAFMADVAQGLVADSRQRQIIEPLLGLNVAYQYYHTPEAGDASFYNRKPVQAAIYLQDKMEFRSLVVNAGIRFDYFDSRFGVPRDLTDPNGQFTFPDLSRQEALDRALDDAPARSKFSPRFGLAYQVTENGVINFSYGHFFQIPPLEFLYANPKFLVLPGLVSGEVMGNAGLKPQRTISYELTYREMLAENIASEISFYYRDIVDLLGTEVHENINGQRYTRYTNREYGNVKGVVVALDVRRGSFYADIDYTFQVAEGSASDPRAALVALQNGRQPNLEVIALDWDQRHTINASINYASSNYTVSLIGRYGSGSPFDFDPLPAPGRPILQFVENNGQKPANFNLNMNATYRVGRVGGLDLSLYLQGYNLLDRRNPFSVFADSGSAESTASLDRERASLERATFTTPEAIRLSTSRFEAPRELRIGAAVAF